MSRPASLAPRARREASEAVAAFNVHNPRAAQQLRDAIVEAAALLGRHPEAGRRNPDLVGTRYRLWSLVRFQFLLIYNPDTEPPRIVRIVHTSRDLPEVLADLLAADGGLRPDHARHSPAIPPRTPG